MESMGIMNNSFWKNRNVLVTGHTGFKGSWLTMFLLRLGAKVSGIGLAPDVKPSLYEQLNISSKLEHNYFADIRNQSLLDEIIFKIKPEVVFHLAAQPLVRESYRDPLGTWTTNVIGSLNILNSLSKLKNYCSVVIITTDKVYKNKEWLFGYRENDQLGGHDPYSSSKAACELAIESWRASFCQSNKIEKPYLAIATARSGNVIGGGDWSKDRIVPDTIISLSKNEYIPIRNPSSTRPWQHVLEPLSGYLVLAEKLYSFQNKTKGVEENPFSCAFNFGPNLDSNKNVLELVNQILIYWPGEWKINNTVTNLHEAKRLHLNIDKAFNLLDWMPRLGFDETVQRTVNWYKNFYQKDISAFSLCLSDLDFYLDNKD